ncbi:DUF6114 domain-containing protein [Natrinema salinisoli]|uniref:DUF6114 domain-containing protein n=1 Tax=Natrinema salinisoli TaxID=2878535 RepID=UPI001CEFB558|nr:DUF6114 domain-containing protein [Natrinema salinisoli]
MATQNGQDDAGNQPTRFESQWDQLTTGFGTRWNRFNVWRSQRPFLGGVLLCLAGILIAWVPMQILPDLLFIGGGMTGFLVIGTTFGVFVFLSGVYALYKPEHSREAGVVGVVLSILSLFGSLGGLLFGMLFGIIGGNLCFAWKPAGDRDDEDDASEPGKVETARSRLLEQLRDVAGAVSSRLRTSVEAITGRESDE